MESAGHRSGNGASASRRSWIRARIRLTKSIETQYVTSYLTEFKRMEVGKVTSSKSRNWGGKVVVSNVSDFKVIKAP